MPRRYVVYDAKLTGFARKLRNQMTKAEIMLWERLKAGQLLGYRFHRQKPVGEHIVDFYCPALRLAIEIDGATHFDRESADEERDKALLKLGVVTLRFGDRQVKENSFGVIETIKEYIVTHAQIINRWPDPMRLVDPPRQR